MPLIPAKCTNCGGTLEVDAAKEAAICPHCGSAFITEKAVNNYNTYNQIHADTVIVQGQRDFEVSGGVLKEYRGASIDVVVPDGVYEIGPECFKEMRIRSVVLPEGLRVIGDKAFFYCGNLQSVKFMGTSPVHIAIGSAAFSHCYSLQTVTFPAGGGIGSAGSWAFLNCTSLQSIELSEGAWTISDSAFEGCQRLSGIRIPQSVRKICPGAFGGCAGLREVSFSEGLEEIQDKAFAGCSSLTSIRLPGSLKEIGHNAFTGCISLQNVTPESWVSDTPYISFDNTPIGTACLERIRMKNGTCRHCGHHFTGLFKKVCSSCGRPKDY